MENIKKLNTITSEEQYIDKLSNISATSRVIDFNLLSTEDKIKIEEKEKEILDYISNNTITPENKDEIFSKCIDMYNDLGSLIKHAKCSIDLNSLEIKTLDKKLHSSIEYTTETLFYGLHLKKHFLNTLPVIKTHDFDVHNVMITMSDSIALYHILSTLTVKGLNKENFAFAHILYKLSEISKIYQHYDSMSLRLNQRIGQWSIGLTSEQAQQLTAEVENTVKAEIVS